MTRSPKKKGLGPKGADRNTKFWLKETETKLLQAFTNRKIDTYTTLLSLATPDCANACEKFSSSHDEWCRVCMSIVISAFLKYKFSHITSHTGFQNYITFFWSRFPHSFYGFIWLWCRVVLCSSFSNSTSMIASVRQFWCYVKYIDIIWSLHEICFLFYSKFQVCGILVLFFFVRF